MAPLYELAIYTHGSRDYALAVRARLEAASPGLKFAGVVSRDCCPDLRGEKSLARLFPGGAARALILDDRLDVWTRGEDQTARVLVVRDPRAGRTLRREKGAARFRGRGASRGRGGAAARTRGDAAARTRGEDTRRRRGDDSRRRNAAAPRQRSDDEATTTSRRR